MFDLLNSVHQSEVELPEARLEVVLFLLAVVILPIVTVSVALLEELQKREVDVAEFYALFPAILFSVSAYNFLKRIKRGTLSVD